jgi:hypothetical protein
MFVYDNQSLEIVKHDIIDLKEHFGLYKNQNIKAEKVFHS